MARYVLREESPEVQPGAEPSLAARLLRARAIHDPDAARIFLAPDWERDTHDPFLMKGMERAVQRILRARAAGERVLVWSDYDMDGIPGAVVLTEGLRKLGCENVHHYTPHRNREGFGLNRAGIERAAQEQTAVLITVDCGIGDTDNVAYASSLGMDVIVTDHHMPGPNPPAAYATLNPKQADCAYPEKMLCGAAVAFKLVQALFATVRRTAQLPDLPVGAEKWALDLVGMSTVADLVPLTGENRALAHYGLIVLRKSRRAGLQALLTRARADQRTLTEDDIAFTIAPRINAASRMGHARDAYDLLVESDPALAAQKADALERINRERKGAVAAMAKEIKMRLKKLGEPKSVLVMGSPAWKPSLLGLVASSLVEEYERPVFLWGREESAVIKGSCRSDGSVSVYLLMQEAREVFLEYGGHELSGGFSVDHTHIHTLESALVEARARTPLRDRTQTYLDADLSLHRVTYDTYREIARFAPFGIGNPKPLFRFAQVHVDEVRLFGKGREHIELRLSDATASGVGALAFFAGVDSFSSKVAPGDRVDVIGTIESSSFRGRRDLRIRIVDVV